MKVALFFLGLLSSLFLTKIAQAQTNSGLSNTIRNSGSLSPDRLDNVRPVRQQNFLIDSSSGSQQFFRDGRDSLYLLPAENAEPILKIDDTPKIQEGDNKDANDVNSEEELINK